MFILPTYHAPDFSQMASAPEAVFLPADKDGVAPDNFHAMSIYPEYFHIDGHWVLAEESRMDCVAVLTSEGRVAIREFRTLKAGEKVAVGRTEDGSEGIYVHSKGFADQAEEAQLFAFRQNRSCETAFSRDYDELYELLEHERLHGKVVWVLGPACSFDADTRVALSKIIDGGYAHALLAGNALATHDLEAALFGTALGQDVYTQRSVPNGHYCHLELLNQVRRAGSVANFLAQGDAKGGIIEACLRNDVPFVLAGSIRDDGPLPEVYGDVYKAQDAMRDQVRSATTVISLASALHSIATGNMTPSFRVIDGNIRPVFFYCVDVSEFLLRKLHNRGSLSSRTIVANVQDFVTNIARKLCD